MRCRPTRLLIRRVAAWNRRSNSISPLLEKKAPPVAQPETTYTPVKVISKPIPVYTDAARRAKVEGEVLVQVLFKATGEIRVLGVTRGLGHGLDEAAIAAAQKVRFTPAIRDGVKVDSTATLHIVFALS